MRFSQLSMTFKICEAPLRAMPHGLSASCDYRHRGYFTVKTLAENYGRNISLESGT
jgi:hypothetical protein